MKSTKLVLTVRRQTVLLSSILGLLTAGVQTTALARSPPPLPTQFSGLLNDYTPTTVDGPLGGATIKGAPYEMHGRWTMDLNPQRSKATFSAEMTMETSEVANASSVFDPGMLNPHVHHVSMTNGVVTTDWQRNCPALKPPVTGGFAVTGSLYVTANGSKPPFGNPSPVTICILGGTGTGIQGTAYVGFSNLTLTIGAPANSHFSSLPIHGVITKCGWRWGYLDSQSCKVAVE